MSCLSRTSNFMRVLIAEHQFEQRIVIERSLGLLGYFRICPVASFYDLIALSHYSPSIYDRFDLLIVNAKLVSTEGLNVLAFFVNNPRFKHVLIYDTNREQGGGTKILSDQPYQQVRLVNTFSYEALVDFISLIPQKQLQAQ